MRLVLATPEAINFQGGRVINIGGKKSSKKGPTGPENKVNKNAFLRPTWLPKWTPEASRNVCTRRSATEAAKNASWGAPRAPPDDFGAIFLPHRYPGIPNFAHLGPWERTIIKEIDLKQLKHRIRHASGRWPGEFFSRTIEVFLGFLRFLDIFTLISIYRTKSNLLGSRILFEPGDLS